MPVADEGFDVVRIEAEEVASGGFGLLEKLDAPITIHQGIGVVLRRFGRIPGTHVNDARILENFESLEIRFLDAAKFLGGLADPGLHGAFEQAAHDFQIPTALGKRFHEMAQPRGPLIGFDHHVGKQYQERHQYRYIKVGRPIAVVQQGAPDPPVR